MSKIGLKLQSTDFDIYNNEAAELFAKHIFDYIELYIVPETTDQINKWKKLEVKISNGNCVKIPYMLHAADYKHNINLSNNDNFEKNKEYFAQVEQYRQELNSKCTIISSGAGGYVSESIRQLKNISPKNILIKNNIYKMENIINTGSTIEEISKIKNALMCGFCLDISDAICTANIQNQEPYEYLRGFNSLHPLIYSISGNNVSSKVNTHGNLENTTYDYSIISLIIRNNALITINSDNKTGDLTDFKNNVIFLKRYCK